MTTTPDEDLAAIHEALADDGVYIHPDLESYFTPEQVAAIRTNVAQAEDPVFVVAFPLSPGDAYAGNPADLLTRLHAAHPEPGIYLTNTRAYDPSANASLRLEGRAWDVPGTRDGDFFSPALSTVGYEEHEQLGSAFQRATELLLLPYPEANEISEQARAEWRASKGIEGVDPGHGGGGEGFDATTVVLSGVLLVVVLAVLVSWRKRRGKQSKVLPTAALTRIRDARDRALATRARDDVLALGERIDDSEITGDGNTSSWRAALDHYAAARRLVDDEEADVLDMVGAIVLADDGDRALTAALDGTEFTSLVRCFLNPLHGEAPRNSSVENGGRKVTVPLCKACHTDLRKDRVPDTLAVERRGRPVRYFETDAEPWASTGYGALEPDLVRKLQGER